jgi:hypothetical protein
MGYFELHGEAPKGVSGMASNHDNRYAERRWDEPIKMNSAS